MPAHTCHAIGCKTIVPPTMFMCRPHWFSLPETLRNDINATAAQKISREYLDAAKRAREWIANAAK